MINFSSSKIDYKTDFDQLYQNEIDINQNHSIRIKRDGHIYIRSNTRNDSTQMNLIQRIVNFIVNFFIEGLSNQSTSEQLVKLTPIIIKDEVDRVLKLAQTQLADENFVQAFELITKTKDKAETILKSDSKLRRGISVNNFDIIEVCFESLLKLKVAQGFLTPLKSQAVNQELLPSINLDDAQDADLLDQSDGEIALDVPKEKQPNRFNPFDDLDHSHEAYQSEIGKFAIENIEEMTKRIMHTSKDDSTLERTLKTLTKNISVLSSEILPQLDRIKSELVEISKRHKISKTLNSALHSLSQSRVATLREYLFNDQKEVRITFGL